MKSSRTAQSLALAAALLALAACKKEAPESFNTGTGDPMDAELANAAPAALPPMLKSSHPYRCKDNSLIFIDFMTDDMTATLKTAKDGPVTPLKAPEAGKPFVSADAKATVTAAADGTITYNGTSCKAG